VDKYREVIEMPDGSLTFSTALDNKQLEKELSKATKKVEALEKKIAGKESAHNQMAEQLSEINDAAEKARTNVERLQKCLVESQTVTTGTDSSVNLVEALEKKISGKEAEHNQIADQLKKAKDEAVETYENVIRLKKELAKRVAITSAGEPPRGSQQYYGYREALEAQRDITKEIADQEEKLKEKEVIAQELQGKEQEIRFELERQTAELTKHKSVVEDLQNELAEQEAILRQKETEAARLSTKDDDLVAELERQNSELTEQKTIAGEITEELERRAGAEKRSSQFMGSVTKQLETELSRATRKVEALEKKISGKEAERNQIAERLEDAGLEAEEAREKVEQLQRCLEKNQVEGLEKKIAEKGAERNRIAEQLQEANKEAIEALRNVEQLKKELTEKVAITSGPEPPSSSPAHYDYYAAQAMQGEIKQKIADQTEILRQKEAVAQELQEKEQEIRFELERQTAELTKQKSVAEDLQNELTEQEAILRQKEKEAARLSMKDADLVAELERQNSELKEQKTIAREITEELERRADTEKRSSQFMGSVTKQLEKLSSRISRLVPQMFVFSMLTTALRSVRTWMGKVLQTNDEASAAMARLRGALLTMVQPLVSVVIPVFTALVNLITRVVTALASFFALLSGKSLSQTKDAAKALYEQTDALESTGSAAEEAGRELAGFDEINKLSGDTGTEAGGGVSDTSSAPTFDFDSTSTEQDLNRILGIVELIGAALAAWKISSMLGGGLDKFAAALLLVIGTIEFLKGVWDAWENGVSWDNIQKIAVGLTGVIMALYVLFGPFTAGIGAIVGGLTMLVTAFHDAAENGWNLQNTLLAVAGLLMTGLGIAVLTGSFIPLLIAAIAALLLALTVATGHGEELIQGVQDVCEGFLKFIKGVFSGDIGLALDGIGQIFDGLGEIVGAVLSGIRDSILSFLDWLDEKTGGKFSGIINFAKGLVTGFFGGVIEAATGAIDGVKKIFEGLTKFLTGVFTGNWDLAWEGIKDIFKGVWNTIVALLEGAINIIIRGVNFLISKLNTISFDIPDWVPVVGGKSFGISIPEFSEISIPRLAQGAVIPPNREFLAVLGDQKSGTNIETPLATMVQAFKQALGEMGYGGSNEATMVINGEEFGRLVYKYNNRESSRIGVSFAGVRK
jgi:hypothetical protein